jgi:hypothetical protein
MRMGHGCPGQCGCGEEIEKEGGHLVWDQCPQPPCIAPIPDQKGRGLSRNAAIAEPKDREAGVQDAECDLEWALSGHVDPGLGRRGLACPGPGRGTPHL